MRREIRRRKSIYRCKGIVFAADAPDKRFALEVFGRRTEIAELGTWDERTPRSQIVAIGSSINDDDLTIQFDYCTEED